MCIRLHPFFSETVIMDTVFVATVNLKTIESYFLMFFSMRKEIFDRVVSFKKTDDLSDEQKRLVDKLILHGRRNG